MHQQKPLRRIIMKKPSHKIMNRFFCPLIALLILGTASPSFAQQEKSGKKDKQPKQEQQNKIQKDSQKQGQPQVKRPSLQGKKVQPREKRGVWQQHRARSWQAEHRTWKQRGGYDGYRIPQNHYRSYFGRDHRFRIYRRALVMYEGYPCFQYNGFWFSLVDPWPEYWSDNWYEKDDVYIIYSDDGYYLYNRRHPEAGVTINVFVN
jgi:hypothetical protein